MSADAVRTEAAAAHWARMHVAIDRIHDAPHPDAAEEARDDALAVVHDVVEELLDDELGATAALLHEHSQRYTPGAFSAGIRDAAELVATLASARAGQPKPQQLAAASH